MTITDLNDEEILSNLQRNVEENAVQVEVLPLDWGDLPAQLTSRPFDMLVASDVFYDEQLYDDLLCSVTGLMQLTGASLFLTVYRERSAEDALEAYLQKWGLELRAVAEVEEFVAQYMRERQCEGKFAVFVLGLRS